MDRRALEAATDLMISSLYPTVKYEVDPEPEVAKTQVEKAEPE